MTSGERYGLDPGEELLAPPRPPMRRRTRVLLGAAAVVLFAVVAVLVARPGRGPSHPAALPTTGTSTSTSPSASPSPSGPVPVDVTGLSNRQVTIAFVEQWIATVRPPPGTTVVGVPVTTSDSPAGRRSPVVARERIWDAPGTIAGTIAFYQLAASSPDHLVSSGNGISSVGGKVVSSELSFSPPASATWAYTQPQIQITVTAHGGGVEVTAEASAIVLPTRTAAEHIPASATAVAVTVTRPHRATARRTLTGAALRKLAGLVNSQTPALPVAASGWQACLGKLDLTAVDRLSFVAPGHTIALRVIDSCPSRAVRVEADGRTQPGLKGARRIDRAVIDALGLPSAYRIN